MSRKLMMNFYYSILFYFKITWVTCANKQSMCILNSSAILLQKSSSGWCTNSAICEFDDKESFLYKVETLFCAVFESKIAQFSQLYFLTNCHALKIAKLIFSFSNSSFIRNFIPRWTLFLSFKFWACNISLNSQFSIFR